MQQDSNHPDGEQYQKLDWELASYGRRVGAWALDFVGFALPVILLIFGMFVFYSGVLGTTSVTTTVITPSGTGVTKEIIEEPELPAIDKLFVGVIIASAIILVGYIVWWLFTLINGQTPGKQIVGIRVIKDNGEPSGWGYTFLREFVIKFLLIGFLSQATFGIVWLVDYLWPLWDRAEKMQTLHDKLLGTIVVRYR
ncbi:MAG: RDD family protein [Chloroflexi bacterium]|nr:RDD family protein [Chloroflexota bacterium]